MAVTWLIWLRKHDKSVKSSHHSTLNGREVWADAQGFDNGGAGQDCSCDMSGLAAEPTKLELLKLATTLYSIGIGYVYRGRCVTRQGGSCDRIDLADESWQPTKLELQARLGASKERQLELEWRLQQAQQKVAQAQVQHAAGHVGLRSKQAKTGTTESCPGTGRPCCTMVLVCTVNKPRQAEQKVAQDAG